MRQMEQEDGTESQSLALQKDTNYISNHDELLRSVQSSGQLLREMATAKNNYIKFSENIFNINAITEGNLK